MVKIIRDSHEWEYDPNTETLTVYSKSLEQEDDGTFTEREETLTDTTISSDCEHSVKVDVAQSVHLDWVNRK